MARKGISIMVVEDSATQAEQIRHVLDKSGYDVAVAGDGKEAISMMRRNPPSIVISDIIMPEMDGYELCRLIKSDEALRQTPVILLTSLSDPSDVLRGLECGADNFITKPYDEEYLLARIGHIMANLELRRDSRVQTGVEVLFNNEKFFITSERRQVLDLLLSSYETAVRKNSELVRTKKDLEILNQELEKRVMERTAALMAEVEERKHAEDEVKKLNEELEIRVRQRTAELQAANDDLEAFSYSISHDLKAPLRAIGGYSSILMTDYADKLDGDCKVLLRGVHDNARQMACLIDDILSFSRAGRHSLELSDVDMENLVIALAEELKAAHRDRCIDFRIGKLPSAVADASAVRQVFSNLLSNAVKFTRMRETTVIEISGEQRDRQNVYCIKDNGVGFDQQYADKMFSVFQRLHNAGEFEGTGIGLAIAKRFLSKLGGRIWAEGKVGEGATFYFSLPVR